MNFGAALLRAVLEEHLPAGATGLVVAVSGGADSACLLAAIAQLGAAVHRSRGLTVARRAHRSSACSPPPPRLREASVALCRRLQIPLTVVAVEVEIARRRVDRGGGARCALSARSRSSSQPGECLLTAHHAQDQAETLLLQLLRGAGLKGLSAMPMCRPFARGWHLRPLLDVAQRDLREFAATHGIAAVDDPMNRRSAFRPLLSALASVAADRATLARRGHRARREPRTTSPRRRNCWISSAARRRCSGCATATRSP